MIVARNRLGIVTRRQTLLGASAAVLAGALPFRFARAAEDLVVTMYGGEMERGWRRNVVDPFEDQFDAAVTIATGTSLDNLAKMRAQRDDPQIDVVCMDPIGAIPAATFEAAGGDPTKLPSLHSPLWAPDPEPTIKTGSAALALAALEVLGKP